MNSDVSLALNARIDDLTSVDIGDTDGLRFTELNGYALAGR